MSPSKVDAIVHGAVGTLKSNNVEFVQYCGGHFENGGR
jgi:hypothetical protein